MIQRQLKLKLTKRQERDLERYLFHLTSAWNWAIRKIENDARDGVYWRRYEFQNLLTGHAAKIDVPSHILRGVALSGFDAWARCFKKIARKPRLKGQRNRLNSIPFPDPFSTPKGNRIKFYGWERVRFYAQQLPEGKIKCGRVVKRATGWYLCLFIDAQPNAISAVADGAIGIDPGFKDLLALSTGEKIAHANQDRESSETF